MQRCRIRVRYSTVLAAEVPSAAAFPNPPKNGVSGHPVRRCTPALPQFKTPHCGRLAGAGYSAKGGAQREDVSMLRCAAASQFLTVLAIDCPNDDEKLSRRPCLAV